MSNNRKNTFYIASIEETNVSNESQEAALEEFFNKKKLEKQPAPVTTNTTKGSYRPTEPQTLETPEVEEPVMKVPVQNIVPEKKNEYFVSPILGRQEMVESNTTATNQRSGTKRYADYRKKTTEEQETKYNPEQNEYGIYNTEQYLEILETGKVSERKPRPKKAPKKVEEVITEDTFEEEMIEPILKKRLKNQFLKKK